MDLTFNKNEDRNKLLVSDLRKRLNTIKKGGGKARIEKQHKQGKMTARERVAYILDKDSRTIEIGSLAGFEMYEAEGGCPSGGVVVVMGHIKGRLCIVVANDATVNCPLSALSFACCNRDM